MRIETGAPARFGPRAQVAIHAWGLVLVLPVLACALAISLGKFAPWKLALPLAAIAGTLYVLPFGQGNVHVARVVRALDPAAGKDPGDFIVQLTLAPRLRTGLWAEIEDADDIGWLRLTETELIFVGDSIRVQVPHTHIRGVRSRNMGLRGLYLYGNRVVVELAGDAKTKTTALEFAERSSWVLPGSRRTARRLLDALLKKLAKVS